MNNKNASKSVVSKSETYEPHRDRFSFGNLGTAHNDLKLQVIQGIYNAEEWGAWSDGRKSVFVIEVDKPYPLGGRLLINVVPAINTNLKNDKRTVKVAVDGNNTNIFKFSSPTKSTIEVNFEEKDPGSQIFVGINHIKPLKFSDITDSTDTRSVSLGLLSVELVDGSGPIQIQSVTGAYERESDGVNWWHWVEQKVTFELRPQIGSKKATRTKLQFEYGIRGKHILTLNMIKRDGSVKKFLLKGRGTSFAKNGAMFKKTINIPPDELLGFSIETDGKATPLSKRDTRLAAWIIRNVNIVPVIR